MLLSRKLASYLMVIILLPGAARFQFASAQQTARPNMLLLLADNQGWKDIGYNGSEIRTPNLDRLAAAGVRFDSFYVYPMCSPTRAALMSGRAPSRYGINGAIGKRSRHSLPAATVTLADSLKAAGYETAITGKWHLGLRPEVGPLNYGFDHTYGFFHGQIDKLTHRYKNGDRSWHRMDKFVEEDGHSLDLITAEAIRFVKQERNQPFFLYVPFGAPHPPLQEENRWTAPYEGEISEPSRRLYAAAVSHMDYCIGELLNTVEQTGQRENTLVVFFSDNGAIENWLEQPQNYEGRFGPYPVLGDNRPLRGWIGDLYDGCIRTPAFLNWPGVLQPAIRDETVSVLDLYPTLVALAGGKISGDLRLEGRNIWPALSDDKELQPTVLYWKSYNGQRAAVRDGRWKLHVDRSSDQVELYDMQLDPAENNNIAAEQGQVAKKLREQLDLMASLDP